MEESVTDEFSIALGQRLRMARRQRGWSLGEVEANTGGDFKASVVGAYERGERAISVHRFASLSAIYGFNPAELLPLSPEAGEFIDLDLLASSGSDEVAERYLNAIRMMRKQPGVTEVRHTDLVALGAILQTVASQG